MDKTYDYLIVGGGIAGLSIAETISRYNKSVLIIEKNKQIGFEASSKHQNWFHVGSLYAILNDFKYMGSAFENLKVIKEHYKNFKNNNIVLKNGEISFKESGWFNQKKINYLVTSRNNNYFQKFNFLKKISEIIKWELKIKKFIIRHNSLSKYNWKSSINFFNSKNLLNYSRKKIKKGFIKNTYFDEKTHFTLEGFDTTMNSNLIMNDLFTSFQRNNGDVLVNSEVIKIQEHKVLLKDGRTIQGNKIILANSKNVNTLLNRNIVKTKISPIAILKPSLELENFARLSPDNSETFNHLSQIENGDDISIIADGTYSNENDDLIIKQNEKRLKEKIIKNIYIKNNELHIYSSHKTEFLDTKSEKRNYLYNIIEIDRNIIIAIPGKFSLCFSLAHKFKEIYLNNEKIFNNSNTQKLSRKNILVSDPYYKRINK